MNYKMLDLGLIDYNKAYLIQKENLSLVKSGTCDGVIVLAEHPAVFTIGRSSRQNNFLISQEKVKAAGADIVHVDRGGDITFHGPGQIVVYPIFNLAMHTKDMHQFLRKLEQVTINTLDNYNIRSFRLEGRTGCWTKYGKIASIGIAASSWVTYHGLALNANTDNKFFDMINPCGYKDIKMISMNEILLKHVDMHVLKSELLASFEKVFHIKIYEPSFAPSK
jgi:lipoyl(octanoyl) transferase